jgi:hemerythrin-like domain-containing protein
VKDVYRAGLQDLTRRQFIGRNGWLLAGALIRPAGPLTLEVLKSGAGRKAKEENPPEISPVEDLMREHGALARILLIYEEVLARLNQDRDLPFEVLTESANLIRRFVEDYHEKLEEKYVFSRFEEAGKLVELVRILTGQHRAGRLLTDRIKLSLDPSPKKKRDTRKQLAHDLMLFVRMYRPHKAREDTILFPAFQALIPPEEFATMGETFEDQEEELFGRDGFEKVVV